jgi:hypothetical protein
MLELTKNLFKLGNGGAHFSRSRRIKAINCADLYPLVFEMETPACFSEKGMAGVSPSAN